MTLLLILTITGIITSSMFFTPAQKEQTQPDIRIIREPAK